MSKFLFCTLTVLFFGFSSLQAEVRFVTTLADDGPGSFRSAVRENGPAEIIFKITGKILLSKPLEVLGDKITINVTENNPITLVGFGLRITGSDFDISNLRIWVGDRYSDPNISPDQDGILILGKKTKPVRQGKISNCTVFAAVDEGISTYGDVSDILFFRNMVLWGLNYSHHQDVVSDTTQNKEKIHHSMSILVSESGQRIQFSQNLLALNRHRNPRIMPGASAVFVNNYVYGWGTSVDDGLYLAEKKGIEKELRVAFLNNYYKGIKESFLLSKNTAKKTLNFERLYGSFYRLENSSKYSIYDKGNMVVDYKGESHPYNANPITFNTDEAGKISEENFSDLISHEQVESLFPAMSGAKVVLKLAGAFPKKRDQVESKIVDLIQNSDGFYIDSPKELNVGYPETQK